MPLPKDLVDKWASLILKKCYKEGREKYGSATVAAKAISEVLEYAEMIIRDYKPGLEREMNIGQIAWLIKDRFWEDPIKEHLT